MDKKNIGIGLIILAVLLFGVGIRNAFFIDDIPVNHESGLGVSRLVGGLLPGMIALIIGVALLQKAKPKS